MGTFGTIGAHTPTLTHTLVPQARDAHQAIHAAIRGEYRVIAGELQATGTAIRGNFRATLLQAIKLLEDLFGAGKPEVYLGDIPVGSKG